MLKPPGPPKHDAPVAQAMIRAERKLLALQAVLAMIGLDRAGRRGRSA